MQLNNLNIKMECVCEKYLKQKKQKQIFSYETKTCKLEICHQTIFNLETNFLKLLDNFLFFFLLGKVLVSGEGMTMARKMIG